MSRVLTTVAGAADSGLHIMDCRWPAKKPAAHSAALQPNSLEGPARQLVLFVGGSKDGQAIMVPFEDGVRCVCIEVQPQVVLQRQPSEPSFALPVYLENYVQRAVGHAGQKNRRFAISLNLQLSRHCQEVEWREDRIATEVVQELRTTIRAQVARISGRILPAPIGHEDISIELTSKGDRSTYDTYKRTLRGECWVVTPT